MGVELSVAIEKAQAAAGELRAKSAIAKAQGAVIELRKRGARDSLDGVVSGLTITLLMKSCVPMRDDSGRFAGARCTGNNGNGGGGGGGGAKGGGAKKPSARGPGPAGAAPAGGGARAKPATKTPPKAAKPADGADLTPKRVWTDKMPKGLLGKGHKETWQTHFTGVKPGGDIWGEGAKPTKQRAKEVHNPIMEKAFRGADGKPIPLPGKGEKKIAIFTMGGPASGKSSVLRGVDTSRFVSVDPDHVKGQLPEFTKAISDRGNTYKKAASMAHEESSWLAKQIRNKAVQQGHHVIIDGTGRNAQGMIDTIKSLKAKGYETHLMMPDIDVKEASKLNRSRADKTGRYVPDRFVREAHAVIPKNFQRVAAAADNAKLFDRRQENTPMIWSKTAGKESTHDDKAWGAFRERNKD